MLKYFFFIIFVINLQNAHGKVYTVCELVEELNNLHSIPREDIYKHLCIVGGLIHTNQSNGEFLGLYRIGQQWWCGQDVAGGSCNVKCSDLYDDDIADDVRCAQKIMDGHGLEGWGRSEYYCSTHQQRVDDCLETIDSFEGNIEKNFTTTEGSTTSTRKILRTTTISTSTLAYGKPSSDQIKSSQADESSLLRLFFISLTLMLTAITVVLIYLRYYDIKRYFRAVFTDSVQLV